MPQTAGVKMLEAKSAGFTKPQIAARQKEIRLQQAAIQKLARKDPAKEAAMKLDIYKAPYLKMRASLDKVDRDIVFSFCQYGMGKVWEWGAAAGGNLWRTTGDISPNWKSVESHGFNQNGLEHWAGPGHWNDPDMLEVGNGNLTPDENYTHMTLWCMLSAPLLIGCDMTRMSPFIISLFSNDEVLAVNQDPLGRQGLARDAERPAGSMGEAAGGWERGRGALQSRGCAGGCDSEVVRPEPDWVTGGARSLEAKRDGSAAGWLYSPRGGPRRGTL